MIEIGAAGIVKRVVIFSLMGLLTAASLTTHVQANQRLEGFFRLGNQNCTDGNTDTCFYYLELTGEAAKALYDNMRSEPEKDDCGGGTVKSDDERLLCFRFKADDYACWFGYDFARRQISTGDFAC